ncbi:hypothetical protein ACJMK2_012219 [Sinanodonta woodiana]|uniref:CUB domain-containing protein n=1 Tax=Sinanodonta woodiana TaxID=1069815 RepID=A0ABD3V9K6_SINWO
MTALDIETVLRCVFLLTVLKWSDIQAIDTYYMDDHCGGSLNLNLLTVDAIKLKLTSLYHYPPNMDCTMTIKTSSTKRFMLFFEKFDVESRSFLSSRCNDWLEVYENGDVSISLISQGITNGNQLCGYQEKDRVYESKSSSLTLRFHSDSSLQYEGFTLILTPFHYGGCDGDEFKCHNSRCIGESNTCNGYNPCGDYSDCPLAGGAIAGIVIASVCSLAAVIVAVIYCRRKRRIAIKRQNVHVPVQTIYPSVGQTVIHTHASYPGANANYIGAQVNTQGITTHVYSGASPSYPAAERENRTFVRNIYLIGAGVKKKYFTGQLRKCSHDYFLSA